MRNIFFDTLYEASEQDPRIILINPDTAGFYCAKYIQKFPQRYVNVGIAEQNSVGIAAGLALEGKIPFIFNILTFASLRCYEQIRLDMCSMDLPVTIVGVGGGYDYSVLGPSHQATEDIAVMRVLPGMTVLNSSDDVMAAMMVEYCVEKPGPKYLRLDRTGTPLVHEKKLLDMEAGFHQFRFGKDVCIVATGRMINQALKMADVLNAHSIDAGVIDLFRIAPFPEESLCNAISCCRYVATLEEHFVAGGVGSALLEALSNQRLQRPLIRLGIPNKFCRVYGDREYLLKENALDVESLVARLIHFMEAH